MINGTSFRGHHAVRQMQQLSSEIDHLQQKIATSKRLLRPSDDPTSYVRSLSLTRQKLDHEAWSANLDGLAAKSANAEAVMGSMSSAMQRALELMVLGSNGTASAGDRAAYATELESIAAQIVTLSDSRDSDGQDILPIAPLEVPVGRGERIAATVPRYYLLTSVETAAGLQSVSTIFNDALAALRETNAAARTPAMRAALDTVSAANTHIAMVRATQGIIGSRIETRSNRINSADQIAAEEQSKIEDLDLSEALARVQSYQLTLQATQATFTRIMSRSLFDLLG